MNFGENLKNIRKYKKISQEELADKLGVSRQSISKWETGENYPSMTNIMCLCDIFNCKINELVHEDMTDFDSLGEEIKMNVVKFKRNEQRKMKGISKFIYVISRIAKIISMVGLVISIIISLFIVPAVISCKIDSNKNTMTIFGQESTYVLNEDGFLLEDGEEKNVLISNLTKDEVKTINQAFELSKPLQVTISLLFSISLVGSLFVTLKLAGYLEKLFKNIHDNDTPFNMDNVFYIKKLAIYTLIYLILSDVLGGIAQGISSLDFNIEFEVGNYIFALIILAISYVFKYGYEIQLDSKGRIYGETNE